MSVRNISRNTLFNLFLKYMNCKSIVTQNGWYFKYKLFRSIPHTGNYICFTFLNLIYVAEMSAYSIKREIQTTITQADKLFSLGKFKDSLKILEPYKNYDNVEVLWRIARNLYNLSLQKGISSYDSALLINEAYECIDKAMNLSTDNFAVHKWMAILVDAKSSLDGLKARIQALPTFKEHLMTAIELNPNDATSIYMLGQYMYNIADMSWLQKTIAKTLFGTPPEATFEEALYYFTEAEEVDPNFYSANLLMLGKTYLKLNKIETGCFWLKCAVAYPVRTDEDKAVRLEAEELLKKYSGFKKCSEKDKQLPKKEK